MPRRQKPASSSLAPEPTEGLLRTLGPRGWAKEVNYALLGLGLELACDSFGAISYASLHE